MADTTQQITVNWRPGQISIRRGTPMDANGNIANNGNAAGIVTADVQRPEKATILTAGTWDEVSGYGGYALTDSCKRALPEIRFVGMGGEPRPVSTLPPPAAASAGKTPTVNTGGTAYENKAAPTATTEKAGVVRQAAAVEDSEEETSPTTEEFNGLLDALREAGIMAESPEE